MTEFEHRGVKVRGVKVRGREARQLFVTPPYLEEEMLFSYFSRLARANCYSDARDFIEYGLCLERSDRMVRRDCCEVGVEDSIFYKGDGDIIRDSGLFDILGVSVFFSFHLSPPHCLGSSLQKDPASDNASGHQ